MVRPTEPNASLLALRRELEGIDRALVRLVATRIETAALAIHVRSETDGRISDVVQEEVVIARAKEWALGAGVPSELAENIFRAILAAGKERFAAGAPASLLRMPPRDNGTPNGRRHRGASGNGPGSAGRSGGSVPT